MHFVYVRRDYKQHHTELHQLRAIIVTMALFMVTATISSQSGHSSAHEVRADAAIIANCQHMVCGDLIARSMPTSSLQVY